MTATERSSFEAFLLAEYEHIAKAHFTTHEAISAFFKNYLAIVGLPLAVVPVAVRFFSDRGISSIPKNYACVPFITGIIVAVLGGCMMMHIVNLRYDTLLYAKTVNGIRNFFYGVAALGIAEEEKFRVLPRTTSKPSYFQLSFVPTVIAFGILNGAYPAIGAFLLCQSYGTAPTFALRLAVQVVVLSVLVHVTLFSVTSRFTELRHGKLNRAKRSRFQAARVIGISS